VRAGPLRLGGAVVLAVDVVAGGAVVAWLAVAGLVVWLMAWRHRGGLVALVASGAGLASMRDLIQLLISDSTKPMALPVRWTAGGKSPAACNS